MTTIDKVQADLIWDKIWERLDEIYIFFRDYLGRPEWKPCSSKKEYNKDISNVITLYDNGQITSSFSKSIYININDKENELLRLDEYIDWYIELLITTRNKLIGHINLDIAILQELSKGNYTSKPKLDYEKHTQKLIKKMKFVKPLIKKTHHTKGEYTTRKTTCKTGTCGYGIQVGYRIKYSTKINNTITGDHYNINICCADTQELSVYDIEKITNPTNITNNTTAYEKLSQFAVKINPHKLDSRIQDGKIDPHTMVDTINGNEQQCIQFLESKKLSFQKGKYDLEIFQAIW